MLQYQTFSSVLNTPIGFYNYKFYLVSSINQDAIMPTPPPLSSAQAITGCMAVVPLLRHVDIRVGGRNHAARGDRLVSPRVGRRHVCAVAHSLRVPDASFTHRGSGGAGFVTTPEPLTALVHLRRTALNSFSMIPSLPQAALLCIVITLAINLVLAIPCFVLLIFHVMVIAQVI